MKIKNIQTENSSIVNGAQAMKMLEISRHNFEKVVGQGLINTQIEGTKKTYNVEEIRKFMESEEYQKLVNGTVDLRNKLNDLTGKDWLYLDFNIIITNLDLVDDEQKKILVSNIKSKILELKELLNERQSHRQHIPNVGKQMFKQQLALVETLEKWIIDFENSLKGQN